MVAFPLHYGRHGDHRFKNDHRDWNEIELSTYFVGTRTWPVNFFLFYFQSQFLNGFTADILAAKNTSHFLHLVVHSSFFLQKVCDFFVIGDFGLVEINKLADFKQGSLFRMGRLKNQNSISSVHDRLYKGRYIAVINSAETFFFICVTYLRNGCFLLFLLFCWL